MTNDEIYWNQIDQIHQYSRQLHQLNSAFFALAATINVTAAWSLITMSMHLKTAVIPSIFIFSDLVAAIGCVLLIVYYAKSDESINRLLCKIEKNNQLIY